MSLLANLFSKNENQVTNGQILVKTQDENIIFFKFFNALDKDSEFTYKIYNGDIPIFANTVFLKKDAYVSFKMPILSNVSPNETFEVKVYKGNDLEPIEILEYHF